MFNKILSAFTQGLNVHFINVEADVSDGMPLFEMVGFLSGEVKEARERVRTALRNAGVRLPPKRITINLSPAHIRKEGTCFDLAVALAVLAALEIIPSDLLKEILVIGELSLDGSINNVNGVLPIVASAKQEGIRKAMLPAVNQREAALVDGIELYGVSDLQEAISFLKGNKKLDELHIDVAGKEKEKSKDNGKEIMDFSQLAGQEYAKRAAQIAAAGFHNLLLIGAPGSGKTMLAKCMTGILPGMTREESLEVTKIYSVAGLLQQDCPLITKRPFRAPHHTVSAYALTGGGRIPRPGEITLAHKGVLFLDELPEFQKNTLEILRQPMEEGEVHISRAAGTFDYPADFILIGAMNPCKCGYFPDYNKCTCSEDEVRRYLNRISRPLLDRIDLCVEMQPIQFADLTGGGSGCTSKQLRKSVEQARTIQEERYKNMPIQFNSQLGQEQLKEICRLGKREQKFMEQIYEKLELTARTYHRILKTARTIADLEGEEQIREIHLSEAVSYRSVDKKFWTR